MFIRDRLRVLFVSLSLLAAALALFLLAAGCSAEEEHTYITTRADLMKALAGKDEIIYVGDIEFDEADIYISISRNVRFVGKPEGSLLKKGYFYLAGSQVESELISVSFENITFDGCYETPAGDPASFASFKAFHGDRTGMSAVKLRGYLDASFVNCGFTRYCAPTGAAMELTYTDGNARDGTRAFLRLEGCTFTKNTCQKGVLWCGGKNTRCEIVDTVFTDNNAYTGVVVLGGVIGTAENLAVRDNNRVVFEDNMPYITGGGGLLLSKSEMSFHNCVFSGNSAPYGGGALITASTTTFADCEFTDNEADGGGGGLYIGSGEDHPVYITNCLISGNRAAEEGAIYVLPADQINIGLPTGITEFSFCTIENNTSKDGEHLIFHPVATEDPTTTVGRDGKIDFYACRISDDKVTSAIKNGENGNIVNSGEKGPAIPKELVRQVAGGRYSECRQDFYAGINSVKQPLRLTGLWIALACGLVLAAAAVVAVLFRRRAGEKAAADLSEAPAPQSARKSGLSGEEIERVVTGLVADKTLTGREADVIREYLEGKNRSQIAEKLFISESTVKNHISKIFSKLDVKNKEELIEALTNKL